MKPTRTNNSTPVVDVLAVSLELASGSWKIAFQDGKHENPAIKTVNADKPATRLEQLTCEIDRIKSKWNLPGDIRVAVLYEAGQDGFWIARALMRSGIAALICDPASLLVNRHARQAKTDRLDAIRLVNSLRAWLRGERDRMRVIRIPSVEDEAQRHQSRNRGELQKETMQHTDRIRKLLRTVGCWDKVDRHFAQRLNEDQVRCFDGSELPGELKQRLLQECERLVLAQGQFDQIDREFGKKLPASVRERVTKLLRLRAVGQVGAARLALELFWRRFKDRREVGACVGLVPQPFDSGNSHSDQGISKQGNRRVRSLLIEMAWFWLRFQPGSAISRWYARRIGDVKSKRSKRIAIVAVARRLAIALWRYVEHDVIPDGAVLKKR